MCRSSSAHHLWLFNFMVFCALKIFAVHWLMAIKFRKHFFRWAEWNEWTNERNNKFAWLRYCCHGEVAFHFSYYKTAFVHFGLLLMLFFSRLSSHFFHTIRFIEWARSKFLAKIDNRPIRLTQSFEAYGRESFFPIMLLISLIPYEMSTSKQKRLDSLAKCASDSLPNDSRINSIWMPCQKRHNS